LSGNVRLKLDACRTDDTPGRFAVNVAALERVMPRQLEPGEITARLGAPWISASDVERFCTEVLDATVDVEHLPQVGSWTVKLRSGGRRSVALSSEWGTARADAVTLLDAALNQRLHTVTDATDDGRRVRNDAETLAALLKGHDVVVSSTRFVGGTDAATLIAAARQAGVKRVIVVGGAGSLEVAPGVALVDTPEFPEIYKAEAIGGSAFLQTLRAETELDWTFLSPSALFEPGERTGRFRLGGDRLLVDASGNSHISMEDYAIALADELETPKHSRARFTVGY
ncbi:NAD(P)H-binding protein, partial [Zoogloea sp.]|uniref:NAD(P)-dependent oxidoreductase n=1 Tax=Zoogloea sp. TaxID=49181 RepID=UPI002C72C29E